MRKSLHTQSCAATGRLRPIAPDTSPSTTLLVTSSYHFFIDRWNVAVAMIWGTFRHNSGHNLLGDALEEALVRRPRAGAFGEMVVIMASAPLSPLPLTEVPDGA